MSGIAVVVEWKREQGCQSEVEELEPVTHDDPEDEEDEGTVSPHRVS